MQPINALSLAPDAQDWLAHSCQPRILHVFDLACNLINERKEVLSIVTQPIGNGPFNLVVASDISFPEHLSLESPVSLSPTQLHLSNLTIRIGNAELWSPRPDWEVMHAMKDDILDQVAKLPVTNYKVHGLDTSFVATAQDYSTAAKFQSMISNLSSSLVTVDIHSALKITSQLAGLGAGLTPAGDDFLMGAVYATWIIHPPEIAKMIATEITELAAPLTTSLSAAWLRSAGKGEAGILWHRLFDALLSGNAMQVEAAIDRILDIGETSGADALAGFTGLFRAWAGLIKSSKISGFSS
jgi:hypothetical protein